MGQNTVSNLLERRGCFGDGQPLSPTDVLRKRVSRGGVVPGWAEYSLWPFPRTLRHWIALLLCSEMRPVRKGKILPRSYVETVKYLARGRNIVQEETRF